MTFDASTQRPAFGITVSSGIDDDPLRAALEAEELGFDAVSLHRDVLNGPPASAEMWTLLTWLAARTNRIALLPLVLALPNRHPAVLAKMAETLDRLSGGRLILGLGGGAPMNESAFRAFGLEPSAPATVVRATEEAIEIVRGLHSGEPFTHRGRVAILDDARIVPAPSRPIPIWVGGFGPRMLDLIGRRADGWIPSLYVLAPERALEGLDRVRLAALHAGRDPESLAFGIVVPVDVQARPCEIPHHVTGGIERVAADVAQLVRGGFLFIDFVVTREPDVQRRSLALEVMPRVRELLRS